jgi:hypothetical protein
MVRENRHPAANPPSKPLSQTMFCPYQDGRICHRFGANLFAFIAESGSTRISSDPAEISPSFG